MSVRIKLEEYPGSGRAKYSDNIFICIYFYRGEFTKHLYHYRYQFAIYIVS